MAQELLHEMLEKFPVLVLLAAGLLDLSAVQPNPALQPDPHSVMLLSSSGLLGNSGGAAGGDAAPTRQLHTQAAVSAQPASPRLPLGEVSHPLENVSHPLENASHPLENVSHPLEEMFQPLDQVSHPLDEVFHPLENVSQPLEEMFQPLDEVSHPLEEASHPLENVSHPLDEVSQTLEVSHPLENISHPLENVSHLLEEMFQPLDEVSHPLDEVSHSLEKVPHPLAESHPLEEDAMELVTGHSSPGPAARSPTPPASPVAANELINHGTNEPAADGPELPPGRDLTPVPPERPWQSPGSPGHPWLGAAGTAPAQGLLLSTEEAEEEEEGRTGEVTDGAAEGLGTAVTLEAGALRSGWHQRRGLPSDVTALDGQVPPAPALGVLLQPGGVSFHCLFYPFRPFPSLAVVSDSCGSGNHSVRLSLSPAGDTGTAGSDTQDTFLALVALQSNSSRALLQIHSCCVSPSASPGAAGAQCCLFSRLPWDCTHIQLLKGGSSRASSFSIQLFQMLNHSVAYLHCQLRVCLPGQPGCEQGCLESVEPLPQPSDRTSHGHLHNLVSLGPVWRMNNRSLYKPVEGAGPAVLLPVLLGSLTGCAVLGSAFMGLWLHQRHRAKPSRHPLPAEFHGL
ncbi:hypothetical protein HGM15179_011258 [Zosterops borbonicus]|uniref:ZP domain-containing protein n=1 Tax=Zosterops borbonicus TaxID=364589 RepID=A0A8K1GDS6_9PASS|nr:hypothetical protein HGM15179_011258 [Zosterops borbonicus]